MQDYDMIRIKVLLKQRLISPSQILGSDRNL
jgi:hypothetical protein